MGQCFTCVVVEINEDLVLEEMSLPRAVKVTLQHKELDLVSGANTKGTKTSKRNDIIKNNIKYRKLKCI